jgi:CheY-like chemotaxis protein
MRVLVAEDDRKVASFIRQGLQEEGYTVDVAADGAAALDLVLGGTPYDLVVLDVMLPKRDGLTERECGVGYLETIRRQLTLDQRPIGRPNAVHYILGVADGSSPLPGEEAWEDIGSLRRVSKPRK